METRIYPTRDLDVLKIAQALVSEYQGKGFEAQQFGDSNRASVQLKKENMLRTITGFNKALGISFQHSSDETIVQVGASDWIDQIAVGAVGLILYPLRLLKLMHLSGFPAIEPYAEVIAFGIVVLFIMDNTRIDRVLVSRQK